MAELTSTTAPGKVFASRSALAEHYKSDWHKYNLKRREAGLPLLLEADFKARLEAAAALKQERQVGKDHLKKKQQKQLNQNVTPQHSTSTPEAVPESEAMTIEPRQCLFDRHLSPSVAANCERMHRKYGFFIPDQEYLVDQEGLIGYLHEKIKLGHVCLYCQRVFTTWQGCQKHMISKRHTKLRYEAGIDLDDIALFYDFTEADQEFLTKHVVRKMETTSDEEMGSDAEWEDVTDDEAEDMETNEDNEEDDEDVQGYEEQIESMGFDITPLGELVLPDGRIIGHRGLRRYYRQHVPVRNDNTAVHAARIAAGERLYNGRVVNIGHAHSQENSVALRHAGVAPGLAAGRAGKGILVANADGAYNQVSIYRYRAAIRKQRLESNQAKRIFEKTHTNMNRMDKKGNRLLNGVSVAHAKR